MCGPFRCHTSDLDAHRSLAQLSPDSIAMADGVTNKSTFPAPPLFYTLYTDETIGSHPFLLQPPPPAVGSFVKFGAVQSVQYILC